MKFEDEQGRLSTPPFLKNWIVTVKGMLLIGDILKKRKISYFVPRQLNQDPLEN